MLGIKDMVEVGDVIELLTTADLEGTDDDETEADVVMGTMMTWKRVAWIQFVPPIPI